MTICTVLVNNKERIYGLISANKIEESRKLVLELLDSPELANNPDVPKAKAIFNNCRNQNRYLSTLVTYMTCIKTGTAKAVES